MEKTPLGQEEIAGILAAHWKFMQGEAGPEHRGLVANRSIDRAFLEGLDLTSVEFVDCWFNRVVFIDAKMASATFQGCEFDHCVFVHSNAIGADFYDCKLNTVGFNSSKLTSTNWKGSSLTRCIFAEAMLDGADFTGTILDLNAENQAMIDAIDVGMDGGEHEPA